MSRTAPGRVGPCGQSARLQFSLSKGVHFRKSLDKETPSANSLATRPTLSDRFFEPSMSFANCRTTVRIDLSRFCTVPRSGL
jgi:hypothetical protein